MIKHAGLFGRNEREYLRVANVSSQGVALYFALEDTQFNGAFAAFKEVEEIAFIEKNAHIVVARPRYTGIRAKALYLLAFSDNIFYYMSLESSKDEIKLYDHGLQASTALTEIKQAGFWKSAPINPNLYIRNFTGNPVRYDVGFGTQSGTFLLNSAVGWIQFNAQSGSLTTNQEQTIVQKPLSQGVFGKPRRLVFRIPFGSKSVGKVVIVDIADGKEDLALYMNQIIASKTGHQASVPVGSVGSVGSVVSSQAPYQEPLQPQKPMKKPTPAPTPPPVPVARPSIPRSLPPVPPPIAPRPKAPQRPPPIPPRPRPVVDAPVVPVALPFLPSGAPEAPQAPDLLIAIPPQAPQAPEAPEAPGAPQPPQAQEAPAVSVFRVGPNKAQPKPKPTQMTVQDELAQIVKARQNRSQIPVSAPPNRAEEKPQGVNAILANVFKQRRPQVREADNSDSESESDSNDWNTAGCSFKKQGGVVSHQHKTRTQPTLLNMMF